MGTVMRQYGFSTFAGLLIVAGMWTPLASPAHAVEPYFCIELVLSRNWPAAKFYCDAAETHDNTGTILAEGIAYLFGAQNAADVVHASRMWRSIPPVANESEWRNVAGMFDQEIDIIKRDAATFDRLAQYKLGVLQETGHLTTADPAAAVFRYQQAANAGLPEAHIALARLYQNGIGVDADLVAAEQHLLKAISLRPARVRTAPQEPTEQIAVEETVAESEVVAEGQATSGQAVPPPPGYKPGTSTAVVVVEPVLESTVVVVDEEIVLGALALPAGQDVRVQAGDTVYALSRLYGVAVRDIIRANNLAPPYLLQIGQVIQLPAQSTHVVRADATPSSDGTVDEAGSAEGNWVPRAEVAAL